MMRMWSYSHQNHQHHHPHHLLINENHHIAQHTQPQQHPEII